MNGVRRTVVDDRAIPQLPPGVKELLDELRAVLEPFDDRFNAIIPYNRQLLIPVANDGSAVIVYVAAIGPDVPAVFVAEALMDGSIKLIERAGLR